MRKILVLALAAGALILGGCSPRVMVKSDFWQDKTTKIGVVMAKIPRACPHTPSSQGLLDMAINNAAASTLDKYLSQIEITTFTPVTEEFVGELQKRGINAVKIDEIFDKTEKPKEVSYTEYVKESAERFGVDKLIVLSVDMVGTSRLYYGFVPLSNPEGFCLAEGVMVDAKTTSPKTVWHSDMQWKDGCVPTMQKWDQPPDYPNLTEAILKAVENAKAYLKRDFFQGSSI